jgi:chemotaxis protein CheX
METIVRFEPETRPRLVVSAQSTPQQQAPTMKCNLPNADWSIVIEAAAREVFEMMLGTELKRSPESKDNQNVSLTAMVGLAGDLCGLLSIRCNSAAAALMASKMLGAEAATFDDSALDAMGEICNMVAGSLKSKVPGLEDRCLLSTPTVIHGHDYRLRSLAHGERIQVPLEFERTAFWIVLDLHG